MFSTDKNELLLSRVQGEAPGQLKGRSVYHSRDLSCFPYDDGCAATSKLSHNAGLNCSTITLLSVWKFNHCKLCAWLTSLSVHTATVYSTSLCTNYLKMSIFMSHGPRIIYCIWIGIFKL